MRILGIMFLILTVGCASNEGIKVLKEVHKNKEKASKEKKGKLLEVKKNSGLIVISVKQL